MKQLTYLQKFDQVLKTMMGTTTKKNSDYANVKDAFANFRRCEELGVCSTEAGIVTRMTDKLQRIANLLSKPADVVSESILDSTLDLAVYSVILYIYLEDKGNNATPAEKSMTQSCLTNSSSPKIDLDQLVESVMKGDISLSKAIELAKSISLNRENILRLDSLAKPGA